MADAHRLAAVVRAARPPFLTLAPLSVLAGIGVAVRAGAHPDTADCALALFGALSAHAGVNLLNEFEDYRSGLDLLTRRTPFSGGSGSLPALPRAAGAVRLAGLGCVALTALCGLWFVWTRGLALLPLGLLGLVLVVAYTPRITRSPLACLVAPGLGFGPVMVMGTAFVLTGGYSWTAWFASLPALCLVSALLLVNQFPDVEADLAVGRHHLPIVLGRRRAARVFGALVAAAFLSMPVAVALHGLPAAALLGVVPAPLGIAVARAVHACADDPARLVRWLGINVAMVHATLALLALGLLLG